jgi:hypothetical protein
MAGSYEGKSFSPGTDARVFEDREPLLEFATTDPWPPAFMPSIKRRRKWEKIEDAG